MKVLVKKVHYPVLDRFLTNDINRKVYNAQVTKLKKSIYQNKVEISEQIKKRARELKSSKYNIND